MEIDTPEKLQINGKFISVNLKLKNKQKTNFERLCEEISEKNEKNLDQGIMENHLKELRRRKMNTKMEKEQIKKDIEFINFEPEEEGFVFKEEDQFDDYIKKLRDLKEEQEKILKKQRYKIIIDNNKNFTKKLLNEFKKSNSRPSNMLNNDIYGNL